MSRGGKFTPEDIDRVSSIEGDSSDPRSKIEELAQSSLIITGYDDDAGVAYKFIDDNVPPYIWLTAALSAYRTIPSSSARNGV